MPYCPEVALLAEGSGAFDGGCRRQTAWDLNALIASHFTCCGTFSQDISQATFALPWTYCYLDRLVLVVPFCFLILSISLSIDFVASIVRTYVYSFIFLNKSCVSSHTPSAVCELVAYFEIITAITHATTNWNKNETALVSRPCSNLCLHVLALL